VLTLFLPEFLAVAGMASIVAAIPVAVAARLPARMRALPLARPGTGHTATRRAVRLADTAVACTVLLGLGAADYGTVQAIGASARERIPDPLITGLNRSPVNSLELGLHVWAWGYFGGESIMHDYEDDLGNIDLSVRPNGNVDMPAMRRGCTNLINAIDWGDAYFPIPVSAEQVAWTTALASTRKQAQDCLSALASANPKELEHALAALNPQPDPVATIIHHLTKLSKPTLSLPL
jgi:hypothetical protein